MSEINVTPLVDVMLVLLIIFMVTAPMMQQGISVDLPEAKGKSLDMPRETEAFFINVSGQGTILINDQPVTEDKLADAVREAKAKNPVTEFYLRSDKNVPYGRVVRIMSILTDIGIGNLNVVTTAEEAASG